MESRHLVGKFESPALDELRVFANPELAVALREEGHSYRRLRPARTDGMLAAMSREDLVKSAISAVNKRDVEAYLACCTNDIQLYTPFAHFTGPNEGVTGIQRFFQDIEDASPDFQLKLERLELLGDQALAFLRTHGTGRVSGVPLDLETANVYDFEGDRIKRIRIFSDRHEALELLGIPE